MSPTSRRTRTCRQRRTASAVLRLTHFAPLYEVAARQLWADRACPPGGILSCAALDRMRDAVRLPPLTWGMDGHTLLP
jgi:hypothetical protein